MSSITPQNHKTRRVLLTALTPHPHISLPQPYTVSKMKETGDEEIRVEERRKETNKESKEEEQGEKTREHKKGTQKRANNKGCQKERKRRKRQEYS